MDRTERFYRIHQLLEDRKPVPLDVFLCELGISRATFKRDLEYLRDRLNAPIEWDRDAGGYRFGKADARAPKYELPGLWFNASEIHALLTMQQLLANLQPGLLEPHIQPLLARLNLLLESGDHAADEVRKRIKILHAAARKTSLEHFETVSHALLKRQRLAISHYSRASNAETAREISPQRLVYYRDNWYLDAWCHLRNDLRSFSADTIRQAVILNKAAKTVADKRLNETLGSGYGIFSGKATHTAVLKFTPERARWVAHEEWHPRQKSRFDQGGFFILEIPYSDDRELVMDILKYGPDIEVIEPQTLRAKVSEFLQQAGHHYQK
ncbi:MAG: YafY family protein [Sulfurimicrobium sp.]|nr:YafY family protein [Sulfurimicrobium sp.]